MYELKKKIGKVFTSKFVGTGPSSYKKKNLPGRGLTKVEKHCTGVNFEVPSSSDEPTYLRKTGVGDAGF